SEYFDGRAKADVVGEGRKLCESRGRGNAIPTKDPALSFVCMYEVIKGNNALLSRVQEGYKAAVAAASGEPADWPLLGKVMWLMREWPASGFEGLPPFRCDWNLEDAMLSSYGPDEAITFSLDRFLTWKSNPGIREPASVSPRLETRGSHAQQLRPERGDQILDSHSATGGEMDAAPVTSR